MLVTAAVNATQGPVATDFPQIRSVAATAHPESAKTETPKSESARSPDGKTGDPKTADGKSEKTVAGAVINPTFRYDSQAQRMVMLMRDEKSGTVIVQVPSEVALRQYEQAVKRAQDDVAATQKAQTGQAAAVSQTSAIEAAALGVLVPFGSAALGDHGTTPAPQPETKAPAAKAAGSVTAGSGARFNFVV